VKCPRCSYEWKIQRRPSVIARVMRSVALKEVRAQPRSEAKQVCEPFLEKLQQALTSSAVAATPDEEEIVGSVAPVLVGVT
jgi:hypothetical protein